MGTTRRKTEAGSVVAVATSTRKGGSPAGRIRRRGDIIDRRPDESPAEPGLSAIERAAAALLVAAVHGRQSLVDHHHNELQRRSADPRLIAAALRTGGTGALPGRSAAILDFVGALARNPRAIRGRHLHALEQSGLSVGDISALSRIAAYAAYQAEILADLDTPVPIAVK